MRVGRIGAAIVDDDNATSIADAEVDCPETENADADAEAEALKPSADCPPPTAEADCGTETRRATTPRPKMATVSSPAASSPSALSVAPVASSVSSRPAGASAAPRVAADPTNAAGVLARLLPRPAVFADLDGALSSPGRERVVAVDGTLAVGDGNGRAGR